MVAIKILYDDDDTKSGKMVGEASSSTKRGSPIPALLCPCTLHGGILGTLLAAVTAGGGGDCCLHKFALLQTSTIRLTFR